MEISLANALKKFHRNGQPIQHSKMLLKGYVAERRLSVYAKSGFVGIHSPISIESDADPNERDSWKSKKREISGIDSLMSLDVNIEWDLNIIQIDVTDTSRMNDLPKDWRGSYIVFKFEGVSLDLGEVEECAMVLGPSVDATAGGEKRLGRPPAYDWEGALISLIARANRPDGLLDQSQSDLEKLIRDYLDPGDTGSPGETAIKDRARKVMDSIGRK